MKTKIVRTEKKFMYNNHELRIVMRSEPYMNAAEPVLVRRVLAPNGGVIPINIRKGDTLKDIASRTADLLNIFQKSGANTDHELTHKITE